MASLWTPHPTLPLPLPMTTMGPGEAVMDGFRVSQPLCPRSGLSILGLLEWHQQGAGMVPGCPPPILHLRKEGLGSQLHRSSLPEPRLEWPKPDAVQRLQLPSIEGVPGAGRAAGCHRDLKVRTKLTWKEGCQAPQPTAVGSSVDVSPILPCTTYQANRLSSPLPDSCAAYHTIIMPSSPGLGSSPSAVSHRSCVHEWAFL